MSKIVEIKTVKMAANKDVVSLLRDFLELAEKGEISAVAIAALRPNDKARTAASKTTNITALIGSIEIIKHRLLFADEMRDWDG